jgi:hypothetical protein
MLNLINASTDKLQLITDAAATLDVVVSWTDWVSSTPTPGTTPTAITTAATTDIVATPAASTIRNVKHITARNKNASVTANVTVVFNRGGTQYELFKVSVAPGEVLEFIEGIGFFKITGTSSVALGGVGTPSTAAQSLTAGSANVVTGTLLQLPTNNLNVGSRFRFHIGLDKTAAGTATWVVALKWGTAGTTADAAVASWTSGTNTAAIDQATLDIEAVVTAIGAAGTWASIGFYVNTLTNATGLGKINSIPTTTAAFDSTLTTPYLHVDITPGASAVMTSVASVERLA